MRILLRAVLYFIISVYASILLYTIRIASDIRIKKGLPLNIPPLLFLSHLAGSILSHMHISEQILQDRLHLSA